MNSSFGSLSKFKTVFSKKVEEHFSNGWMWLVADSNHELKIMDRNDHESPLTSGLTPLLVLDLWEHAYYLKHQNRVPEYVDAFWNVVNWKEVTKRWKEFETNGSTHREWKIAA